MRVYSFFKLISISLASIVVCGALHAESVVARSGDGTLRILEDPNCSPSTCAWVDIDRNPRTTEITATEDAIFQLHDNGDIWRWRGEICNSTSCPHWDKIDSNSQSISIVAGHTNLFQLHENGAIFIWNDFCEGSACTEWKIISPISNTISIFASGSSLYRQTANGEIFQWTATASCFWNRCNKWRLIDNNENTIQLVAASSGTLYQRHRDGKIWGWDGQRCAGDSCRIWKPLDRNAQSDRIVAASGALFQKHFDGKIWQWNNNSCAAAGCSWTKIDDNVSITEISAGASCNANNPGFAGRGHAALYKSHNDGSVWRWMGLPCDGGTCSSWDRITGNVKRPFTRNNPLLRRLFVFDGDFQTISPSNDQERIVSIPPSIGDTDGDGLPDDWERSRVGWGLSPFKANLLIAPVLYSDVSSNEAQQAVSCITEFFRKLPVKTTSGMQGIHVVSTPQVKLTDQQSFKDGAVMSGARLSYKEYRDEKLSETIKGFARGLVFYGKRRKGLAANVGGGGQASHVDWAQSGLDFRAAIHEIGHMLKLEHVPPGNPDQSPFYASLMNYDYNYSFNGSANEIQFSPGKFASFRFDEQNLNEKLPFPASELDFLARGPHNFALATILSATAAPLRSVDFNRNGIFSERGVVADINSPSYLGMGHVAGLSQSHSLGDITTAADGKHLVSFYTKIPGEDTRISKIKGVTRSRPGNLEFVVSIGRSITKRGSLAIGNNITGSPSAIGVNGKIILAVPAEGKIKVGLYDVVGFLGELQTEGELTIDASSDISEIALAETGERGKVLLISRHSLTKFVSIRKISFNNILQAGPEISVRTSNGGVLQSEVAPNGVFNPKTGSLVLVTSTPFSTTNIQLQSRLLHWNVTTRNETAIATNPKWLTDISEPAVTNERPAVVFDDGQSNGPKGRLLVFFKDYDIDKSKQMPIISVFVNLSIGSTPGSRKPYDFRRRPIVNEWTYSRNTPAIAPYNGDFVVGYRAALDPGCAGGPREGECRQRINNFEIALEGSGERSIGNADFDDISHIANIGLRAIRDER